MAVNNEERIKALDAALAHIEKQYGKGSVMKPKRKDNRDLRT